MSYPQSPIPSLQSPVSPLPLFRFPSLLGYPDLVHAVTTRHGGVSQPPWATLNMGGSVKDDPAAVDENHDRVCAALGVRRDHLVTAYLTHSANVAVAAQADRGGKFTDTDALITADPETYLILRFADCVPVLLFDPVRRVVGIVHAGWRGTLALVTQRAAQAMTARFGSAVGDIRAAIGPSIGPCCYEVGDEVVAQTRAVFRAEADGLLHPNGARYHLDLWAANRAQLAAIGVDQVETAEVCTACHVADYFSHRAERGRTGRFSAVIGLRR